ncbi:MAG TPA: molecular chaperone DnaJ [Candidatus Hydrogenedens sp.]|nr:molecular chaperone DnaJ [Candidatus Hydrogenedens sp.]HOL20098.1 molecular chaperone DnaJ [Candidatus Hydrogenedens sp.]HPP59896.1 molecular chaperone DnaJ [Candidatus Hydrogenedens sp.]
MVRGKDLYEILGVSKNATQEEIRRAYLKLAHKYHPDKTGGDKEAEEKLKEINAAYDVLKNPEKRAQYDRYGTVDGQPFDTGGFTGGFSRGFEGFGEGFESPFDDLFDMIFGSGSRRTSRRSSAQRGSDVETTLTITLKESATGARKRVRYICKEQCSECHGTGSAPGYQPETCPQCGGTGQIRASQGFFSITRTCPQCHGVGKYISKPCLRCGGQGRVTATRETDVNIPPGVDEGTTLRSVGDGESGIGGGPPGDLYIHLQIKSHPLFERKGNDLYCEVPITLSQAILGTTIKVPTLIDGSIDLIIPSGTQSGDLLRKKGLGMPRLNSRGRGDLYYKIIVEVPVRLSKRQEELLHEFDDLANSKNYPKHWKFREIKDQNLE